MLWTSIVNFTAEIVNMICEYCQCQIDEEGVCKCEEPYDAYDAYSEHLSFENIRYAYNMSENMSKETYGLTDINLGTQKDLVIKTATSPDINKLRDTEPDMIVQIEGKVLLVDFKFKGDK